MNDWQGELVRAARDAKCRFSSVEALGNEAHGRAATALLRAFGQDAHCSIFIEARVPGRALYQNARPADILILHPDLGVVFVEVKGWMLADISGTVGGTIYRQAQGAQEAKDPWKQAGDAALQLQTATREVLRRRRLAKSAMPFFDWFVAFPNITRAGWLGRGFGESLHSGEAFFAEDLAGPPELKATLLRRLRSKAGPRLPCSRMQLETVLWALGDSVIINRNKKKQARERGGLAGLIDTAELTRKRFTPEQRELIEAEFDGRPQLVRGVAGSGKTSVLVGNFVNMLDRQLNSGQLQLGLGTPEARFLVICYNQTLVPLLRRQIEDAFLGLTHRELPNCVTVQYMNGLEYMVCQESGWRLKYQTWEGRQGGEDRAAEFAGSYCRQLDDLMFANRPVFESLQYDSIYVDEGQDLFAEEYRLLMKLLRADARTGERNIVIFHDDAQNLYGRPRPVWADLGIEIRGRSALMRTCLRNPRQIVEFAFNLLLGTAADTRVATRQFAETRFLAQESLVRELPDRWLVHFAARQDGQAPEVALFSDRAAETGWILDKLKSLIEEEGVRPEDILIVAERPQALIPALDLGICRMFPAMKALFKPWGKKKGQRHNPDKEKYLLQEGQLTLATVKACKGYDCPIVLLAGADLFPDTVEGRASFYVASTRATMRLFVTGLQTPGTLAVEAQSIAALLASPVPRAEAPAEEEQSASSPFTVEREAVEVDLSRSAHTLPGSMDLEQSRSAVSGSGTSGSGTFGSGWKQLLSRIPRR